MTPKAGVTPPVSSATPQRWRACEPGAVEWRRWDGQLVVWVERTGSTHLLGDVASEVFVTLMADRRAFCAAEIGALVFDDTLEDCAATQVDTADALEHVLLELQGLGLARPQPA